MYLYEPFTFRNGNKVVAKLEHNFLGIQQIKLLCPWIYSTNIHVILIIIF